jgi:small subunit ribosomal protein S16
MAVRIRLRRVGRKKAPFYRIVVADARSPRDGRFIEAIGRYAPRQKEGGLTVNAARANHWLDVGALPTDTVRSLLRKAGVLGARHEARLAAGRGAQEAKLRVRAVPVRDAGGPDTGGAEG